MMFRIILGLAIGTIVAFLAGQGVINVLLATGLMVIGAVSVLFIPSVAIVGILSLITYAIVLLGQYFLVGGT